MYSPEMTHVFSGGCAYTFFQKPNQYGLVEVRDGQLVKLQDYETLRQRLQDARDEPRTDAEWATDVAMEGKMLTFPDVGTSWKASPLDAPRCPLDWTAVALPDWVVVETMNKADNEVEMNGEIEEVRRHVLALDINGEL